MSVVMFAMIGAAIHPHWAYWVAFGLYCLIWLDKYLEVDVKKEDDNESRSEVRPVWKSI